MPGGRSSLNDLQRKHCVCISNSPYLPPLSHECSFVPCADTPRPIVALNGDVEGRGTSRDYEDGSRQETEPRRTSTTSIQHHSFLPTSASSNPQPPSRPLLVMSIVKLLSVLKLVIHRPNPRISELAWISLERLLS